MADVFGENIAIGIGKKIEVKVQTFDPIEFRLVLPYLPFFFSRFLLLSYRMIT